MRIPSQPLTLRHDIVAYNIAHIILQISQNDNKDITFVDPDLFYLSLDPGYQTEQNETTTKNRDSTSQS